MIFCPLSSGSSGNSSFLESGGTRILIDAGLTAKRIRALLEEIGIDISTISAILVTHEHSDHISGIGVLSGKYRIPVYANAECFNAMPATTRDKIPASCIRLFDTDHLFFLSGLQILPFSTPHDAARSVGFSIVSEGCKCTVMTDIGHIDDRMLSVAAESDLLLIEANHDVDMLMAGRYPYHLKKRILSGHGHLCNEDCARALIALHDRGVRNVILGHLSQENNSPELAQVTIDSALKAAGISDMNIMVANRDHPLGMFSIS
ncbi:MAG: MBL fold metallo-hydrolase [Clostridia bacterium]|nr:MBL fold metallo-hydrolase [Clostridia bacterium]